MGRKAQESPSNNTELLKPQEAGAPAALAWIAQREAAARKAVEEAEVFLAGALKDQREKPPAKDGTDYEKVVKIARDNLSYAEERVAGLQKRLREFDKAIVPERRDATEKISQAEGERLLMLFWIYEREAGEKLLISLCSDFLLCETPEQIHKLYAEKSREVRKEAMASAVRESHLPEWCKKALDGVI